jgi:hypothetical protein
VPLGFIPVCSEVPTQEVDVVLPLLDSAGARARAAVLLQSGPPGFLGVSGAGP